MFETLTSTPVILTASAAWAVGVVGTCAAQKFTAWRESQQPLRRARVLALAATFGVRAETAAVLAHRLGDTWIESKIDDWTDDGPNAAVTHRTHTPKRAATAVSTPVFVPPLVQDFTAAESPPAALGAAEPHLFMRAVDHVTEFVAHQRSNELGKNPVNGRWEARRSDQGWLNAYRAWARQRSIALIPDSIFLGLLSDAPGVEKKRDRIKCPHTGRVLKNAHGTPLRATHYTICELPLAARATRKPVVKVAVRKPTAAADGPPPVTWAEDLRELSREAA